MIVNPDHMSQAAVDDTLTLLESRRYSGVISPHGWMDPGNWPRLWKLGGIAFPGHSTADDYVKEWQRLPARSSTPFEFGWGYGADLGGLSHQPDADGDGEHRLPVQELRRQGHLRPPEDRRAHLRLHEGGRRPLRPVRRLVRGPARGSAATQMAKDMWDGAEAYLADVGARRRRPGAAAASRRDGALHQARARPAAARRRLGDAAAPRRPAAAARARVDLVRRAASATPAAADVARAEPARARRARRDDDEPAAGRRGARRAHGVVGARFR